MRQGNDSQLPPGVSLAVICGYAVGDSLENCLCPPMLGYVAEQNECASGVDRVDCKGTQLTVCECYLLARTLEDLK